MQLSPAYPLRKKAKMIFGVVKITTATKVSRTVTPRGKKKNSVVEADVTENIHTPG